jgi:polar amino acid transport system permease protein
MFVEDTHMDSSDTYIQQEAQRRVEALRVRAAIDLYAAPWWIVALILLTVFVVILINTNEDYGDAFAYLQQGIQMTLFVSFSAYGLSLVIGLLVGLARVSPPKAPLYRGAGTVGAVLKVVVYNLATFYVEVLRGLPIIIVILVMAFVIVPAVRNALGIDINGSSPPSAIAALCLVYGAFLSETFRAGIQSISRGQIEAARSLGMTYPQTMRYVVLPQAIRVILPPLGNDLIAMIKDSSLVAFLGIRDVTQLAKLWSGQNFLYLQTYFVAAMIYLSFSVIGTRLVRFLERKARLGI